MVVETLKSAAFVAAILVVVTFAPEASENVSVPPLMSEAFNVEMVPVVAERTVVLRFVVVTPVKRAAVAPRFVAVAF
jgi:hypothetical protein